MRLCVCVCVYGYMRVCVCVCLRGFRHKDNVSDKEILRFLSTKTLEIRMDNGGQRVLMAVNFNRKYPVI